MNDMPSERRLSDRIARWIEVLLLSMTTGLLGIVVYFYGDMPKRIDELTRAVEITNIKMGHMQSQLNNLEDAQKVSQNWRDRQVVMESKVERHTEQINGLNRRVEDLEKPIPWLPSSRKK